MSLDDLKRRLNYRGGSDQKVRMRKDKLHSLEGSLNYSYQAETLRLSDGREFKCLINPSKLTENYDWKVLSIPFCGIAVNTKTGEKEKINIKCGDVFTWVENKTHWIVYLRHLEEEAYFRAEIRKCEEQIELENGSKYWVHWQGPTQSSLVWNVKEGIAYNDLNNTAVFYITDNEEIREYIKRFTKITISGKNWEVQVVDRSQGLIRVTLKETFSNQYEDFRQEAEKQEEQERLDYEWEHRNDEVKIVGDQFVKPYSVHTYTIEGVTGGEWFTSNSKGTISEVVNNSVTVQITTGRSGNVDLIYRQENKEDIVFNITIESL